MTLAPENTISAATKLVTKGAASVPSEFLKNLLSSTLNMSEPFEKTLGTVEHASAIRNSFANNYPTSTR